jgi:hypothetical protein
LAQAVPERCGVVRLAGSGLPVRRTPTGGEDTSMSDRTPEPGEDHADAGSAPDDAWDHAGSPAAASGAADVQADPVAAAAQAARDADAEAATQDASTRDTGAELTAVLTSRGYRALLAISALIGIPVALVAFGFLALVHWLEHVVWESLPETLGMSEPAGWYAIVVLTLAGLIVGVTVKRLPGTGGHIPVHGLGGGTPSIPELPAILIAAIVSLTLGTVVGPEAPLVAIGAGAVLVMIRRTRLHHQPQAQQLLAIAGSSAAISTIFGNPVVGAVLMLEVVGLAAGAQVLVALLPAILSAGVGALVFTGLGEWTGFDAPSLTIPGLTESGLEAGDLLWTIPIAIVVAVLAQVTPLPPRSAWWSGSARPSTRSSPTDRSATCSSPVRPRSPSWSATRRSGRSAPCCCSCCSRASPTPCPSVRSAAVRPSRRCSSARRSASSWARCPGSTYPPASPSAWPPRPPRCCACPSPRSCWSPCCSDRRRSARSPSS